MSRPGWMVASAFALAFGLGGCGGGGGGAPPPPPPPPTGSTPTPSPSPAPTPTPSAFAGAVYVGTNNFGDVGNFVVAFGRSSDGMLTPINTFTTNGTGRGVMRTAAGPIRLNPLISEDSLLAVDDRYLLVVNAGSNTVTSFRINADFSLTLVNDVPSGGMSPISIAEHNGLVYVANADADGTFTGPPDQSGNVSGFRLDLATGRLSAIAGTTRDLGVRPADLEFTSDGRHLLVSGINAGSAALASRSTAEISSYGVQSDGSLTRASQGSAASTLPGNASGRNLPNAIGIETVVRMGRQFVIAAESRSVPAAGTPATFASLQTGSLSIWEIGASGALMPRTQDYLFGSSATTGLRQPGWLAVAPDTGVFWITSALSATITGFGMRDDGTIGRSEDMFAGAGAAFDMPSPLANADGFVDVAVSGDGRYLYQLVGLKGAVNVYEIDTLDALNLALRQQATTGLLPRDNLQGIAVVSARGP